MPDASWTTAHPHLAATAARLLDVDGETVRTHSRFEGGVAHVWTPGRGGAQAVVGPDGSAYVRESSLSAAELRQAYAGGARTSAETLAQRPVNHAASAVASMIGVLRGSPVAPATPTGPSEAQLATLVGRPLQQTTPEEIAARVAAGGDGTYLLVGVDRAQGPGHWYVALAAEGGVVALDPIANARLAWPPPAADAARWWADGAPSAVVVEADAHGTRVWATVPATYAAHGQDLVDAWARQPADRIADGKGVWYGFWWTSLSRSTQGGGLRIAALDLRQPGNVPVWDVAPALEVMHQQKEMCAFCRVGRQSVNFLTTLTVEEGALDLDDVHLVRREPAGELDSGWYVGRSATPSGATTTVTGRDLWARRPELARYLGLPVGFAVLWASGQTWWIRNADGVVVWDKSGAAPAPAAAPAVPAAATASAAAGQSQGSAYDEAAVALADPASSSETLLAAARRLRGAFQRFDHGLGLLPRDAAQVMVEAWTRAGTADAWIDLGDWHRRPEEGAADPESAVAAYRRADDLGSREGAMRWVREAYFAGLADERDAAARRIDRLTEDDPTGAAHVLRGWMRFKGYGFPQDAVAAAADQQTAAFRGNADAHFELSVLYTSGRGVRLDERLALDHLKQAANAEHPRAVYNLAVHWATGRGLPRDSVRALGLYLQAADLGHGEAAFTAAVMVLTGDGAPVDPVRAASLLEFAQELGFDAETRAAALPGALGERVRAALHG
ncbi:tetratricopeptide repeat protein [Nocardioides alkalitolerans]|uniref:tetratricopeptide repeat protein n=1 Tax=Nocardioides alkalitolerans TaxID=281714 RepID=UPI00041830A6|nr:tetratricopeptide repeat protein [Nocardioides alkalitolerans]